MFILTLVSSYIYNQWIEETLWKWDILLEDYQKLNILNLYFCFWTQSQKASGPLFRCQMHSKIFFCGGASPDHFWFLNSKRFWVFSKIKVSNFFTIHFIMTQLFYFQLPNSLLKFEYYKKQKSSLSEKKIIFHNFLRTLFWWNVK